jgi:hypothetical protein
MVEQQVFIDFKEACESIRMGVLYNILFEFGMLKKLFVLIKMCLNETHNTLRIGKKSL